MFIKTNKREKGEGRRKGSETAPQAGHRQETAPKMRRDEVHTHRHMVVTNKIQSRHPKIPIINQLSIYWMVQQRETAIYLLHTRHSD